MIVLSLVAFADVPPAPGNKRVPYRVEVEGLEKDRDPALVVHPWSLSNGAPTAEVAEVLPKGLTFGRRVAGTPRFWLVPRDTLAEVTGLEDEAAATWLAANATSCEGDIRPRNTVPEDAPDEVLDRFSMEADPCKLTLLPPAKPEMPEPEAAPPGEAQPKPVAGGMCGCASRPAGGIAVLLGLLALGLRRR